jgi:phosphatidylserine decarboxylase
MFLQLPSLHLRLKKKKKIQNMNTITDQSKLQNLVDLLESNQEIKNALSTSIQNARQNDVKSIHDFYNLLSDMITHAPSPESLIPDMEKLFYIINHSPEGALAKSSEFNEWLRDFSLNLGDFLDTPASIKYLDEFISNKEFHIDDYYRGPSGWQTFNQFLARQVKPGKRPIDDLCNNRVIVSPTDSVFLGHWPIDDDSTVTAKGTTFKISELLDGSSYTKKFKNGIFSHSYLSFGDYHYYHTPVGGEIKEIKKIPGRVWSNEKKNLFGSIKDVDDVGFQFTQTRGYIIIECEIGYVAVIPVGMGHVSSVNITPEVGATLHKGEAFGYFCFGGSDIVMLFEPGQVAFTATKDKHYKQGEKIARAK